MGGARALQQGDARGVQVAALKGADISTTIDTTTEIRPFSVEISQEQIDTLRRRVEATRCPTTELVQDASQGIQLAFSRSSRGTDKDYDFGRLEYLDRGIEH